MKNINVLLVCFFVFAGSRISYAATCDCATDCPNSINCYPTIVNGIPNGYCSCEYKAIITPMPTNDEKTQRKQ